MNSGARNLPKLMDRSSRGKRRHSPSSAWKQYPARRDPLSRDNYGSQSLHAKQVILIEGRTLRPSNVGEGDSADYRNPPEFVVKGTGGIADSSVFPERKRARFRRN